MRARDVACQFINLINEAIETQALDYLLYASGIAVVALGLFAPVEVTGLVGLMVVIVSARTRGKRLSAIYALGATAAVLLSWTNPALVGGMGLGIVVALVLIYWLLALVSGHRTDVIKHMRKQIADKDFKSV